MTHSLFMQLSLCKPVYILFQTISTFFMAFCSDLTLKKTSVFCCIRRSNWADHLRVAHLISLLFLYVAIDLMKTWIDVLLTLWIFAPKKINILIIWQQMCQSIHSIRFLYSRLYSDKDSEEMRECITGRTFPAVQSS